MRVDRAGQHVVYTLAEHDVATIEANRKEAPGRGGNSVQVGQRFPAFIVRDWGGCANLRILLDGRDDHWITSVSEGTGPGKWQTPNAWPVVED